MENINLITNNQDLYKKFSNLNCKVTYNNKVIYEGIFNKDIDLSKYKKSQVVYNFNVEDKHFIFLGEDNENINKLSKLFENKEFDDIYKDAKLFNKAMNLANNLPLYNFDKELFEDNLNKNIRKFGINFQKIYENLSLVDSNKE